ncbi:hypothetical protein [Paenibacillus sp. FSL R10-2771]|uniref:hypothetical protein n=1 Tax=Paenibacillus sp. FSL R10-2771 TaxID=2954693 RepID=UPI0030F9D913
MRRNVAFCTTILDLGRFIVGNVVFYAGFNNRAEKLGTSAAIASPGKLLRTPPGKLLRTPPGKLLRTPPGKLLRTPPGKLLRTPPGKLLRTPPGNCCVRRPESPHLPHLKQIIRRNLSFSLYRSELIIQTKAGFR